VRPVFDCGLLVRFDPVAIKVEEPEVVVGADFKVLGFYGN
jgi:hypothetical protein